MSDARVVHERDEVLGERGGGDDHVLASEVEFADTALKNARGLRFRDELPEGFAYVMEVGGVSVLPFAGGPTRNVVDMLFMRVPIDVVWLIEEEVVATKTLSPWTGVGFQKADTIIELPAGNAQGVEVGDTVRVENGDGG
jgi:hypothetical protein